MQLAGLQKTTLLDFPGLVACTVFTVGCNFRCPFCHNPDLVLGADTRIDEEEFFRFLIKRRGILEGVCITGGEPTLQKELLPFLRRIKELGYRVKLDTNGGRPALLAEAIQEGLLDYVAMDIKNAPGRYAPTVGISDFDEAPIFQSADLLMQGSVPFEFRTTVVAELHTPEDFTAIGQRLAGNERYFLQQFRNNGEILGEGLHSHSAETLHLMLENLKKYIPAAEIRGQA